MEVYPKPVNKQCIKKILEQMNNIFFIEIRGKLETGFFSYIRYQNGNIPVLIINKYLTDEEINDKIKISISNKFYEFELGEAKYQKRDYNITILEIKKNKEDNIIFIELDDKLYQKESELYYDKQPLYTLQLNNQNDISVSYGIFKDIKEINLIYFGHLNTNVNLTLIFNLSTYKLIGLNGYKSKYYDIWIFLKLIIDEFIKKYKYINIFKKKYKYNQSRNEINILIKIGQEDINKKIYFLSNKFNDEYIRDSNELKPDIYINKKLYEYNNYFIPEKEGEYNINIKLYTQLIDCSYMFFGYSNFINLDLFSFDTKNVTNMSFMFSCCKNLKFLDLSSFDTKNVTNMNDMFSNCSNLINLDLSSFDLQNVNDMNSMFYGCSKLNILRIVSFDTKNVVNKKYMYCHCPILNTNLKFSSIDSKIATTNKNEKISIEIVNNEYTNNKIKINKTNLNLPSKSMCLETILEKLLSVRVHRPGKQANLRQEEIEFIIEKSI